MDRRFITVLGVSLVFALVVSSVFYQMTARSSGTSKKVESSDQKDLVVTARPLGVGVMVKPADIKVVKTPAAAFPKGGFSKVEDVLDRRHVIPGLEGAEFVRFGMVHRNTYVNGPTVLAETWQVRARPSLFFAGQMSGVEGYVESAASGLLAGINAAALTKGEAVSSPPRTTAIGALAYYVSHANPAHYQPSNITFGIMPPLEGRAPRAKKLRNQALSERALADLQTWIDERASQIIPAASRA